MGEKKLEMKPHAIMIALPYQGHLNPFVQLAMKLASKGITITFVHTEYAHQQISKAHQISSGDVDIFSEARTSGLDIRYMTISDGFPMEFDRHSNFVEFWEFMLHGFQSLVDEFVGNMIKLSDPSSFRYFLVADTYCSWIGGIARKYNLVNVSFWTQPAAVFAINYYVDLLRKHGHYPPQDDHDYTITYIPGVESISSKDLMSHLQSAETTIGHNLHFMAFEEVVKADFILHNTVQELEPFTLSNLNKQQPTYAIGPVNFSTEINVSKSMHSEVDCTKWLESKPPGSVLYVSFGSVVAVNKEIIQEIAQGLLISEVNFIWSIRRPQVVSSTDGDTDILPVGFENDVKDRGLIVPWCNQFAMLSSVAVGGFMTHCGWNSILESIWCGVPMICHPCLYDQPTNRKLVVDDWRIGANLCDGESVTRDEVAGKIKKLMIGETSVGYKNKMKKFSSMLHNASVEDGSSGRNLDRFLKDMEDKLQAQTRASFEVNGKAV